MTRSKQLIFGLVAGLLFHASSRCFATSSTGTLVLRSIDLGSTDGSDVVEWLSFKSTENNSTFGEHTYMIRIWVRFVQAPRPYTPLSIPPFLLPAQSPHSQSRNNQTPNSKQPAKHIRRSHRPHTRSRRTRSLARTRRAHTPSLRPTPSSRRRTAPHRPRRRGSTRDSRAAGPPRSTTTASGRGLRRGSGDCARSLIPRRCKVEAYRRLGGVLIAHLRSRRRRTRGLRRRVRKARKDGCKTRRRGAGAQGIRRTAQDGRKDRALAGAASSMRRKTTQTAQPVTEKAPTTHTLLVRCEGERGSPIGLAGGLDVDDQLTWRLRHARRGADLGEVGFLGG
jgi:hypothetical protein